MSTIRAALALLLAFAVPIRAETAVDPLWYLIATSAPASDARAVSAEGGGPADAMGLAGLQADLLLLSDGFEGFRDEAQVKETLARLEPRMSPELRPFFKDRASSLGAIYRTLAVADYTWALRFPEPPCEPLAARRHLLANRDGLFQTETGEASPWLVSLLGPQAEGKSAEQALDQASSRTSLTGVEYERLRARIRKLTMALASEKAVGSSRAKLYCARAAVFSDLAAAQRANNAALVSAARVVAQKPEESVFVVVWKSRRAAAVLLKTKSGPMLVTDAAVVAETDHPNLFAYSASSTPVELAATVVRRYSALGVAVLAYTEDTPRPALALADGVPAKDDLVLAVGHTLVSGLWTRTSGLVTKAGETGFQTDAAVSPEMSGGPVLNEAGEVAGLLVLRPADTEEGHWPVAVPAPVLARWLDDPSSSLATGPAAEAVEDAGTSAILTHAGPSPNTLTEAGLGAWNIPNLPPPPPTPHGVCVQNCGGSGSSGSSYSGGGSGELGQALGELGAVLIMKGIPALFRGIGKLFKGSGRASSAPSIAERSKPVKAEPPPKPEPPKPPDPVLTLTVTSSTTDEAVLFTARVAANRADIKLDRITVDFTVNEAQTVSAETDPSGIVVLTVKNPPSVAAHKSLDEESAKHPWLTNASRGISKQGACEVTLLFAAAAVGAYVAIRAPVVVLTAGGLALRAPRPAGVNACRGIAGATTAAAAAACASILGEDAAKRPSPPPSNERPETSVQRPNTDSTPRARQGESSVAAHADSAQDDLKKAEQEQAAEEGGGSEAMTSPGDPGGEPPNDSEERKLLTQIRERDRLLDRAKNPKLRDAIENLFRENARVGSGSSMDAYRFELKSGVRLSKAGHAEKLIGRRTQLMDLWKDPSLSSSDKQIVKELLIDIQSSLGGL